jgi:hypothetical protein
MPTAQADRRRGHGRTNAAVRTARRASTRMDCPWQAGRQVSTRRHGAEYAADRAWGTAASGVSRRGACCVRRIRRGCSYRACKAKWSTRNKRSEGVDEVGARELVPRHRVHVEAAAHRHGPHLRAMRVQCAWNARAMRARACVCLCVCLCVHACAHACARYACLCVCRCVCLCVCACVHACTRVCVRASVCARALSHQLPPSGRRAPPWLRVLTWMPMVSFGRRCAATKSCASFSRSGRGHTCGYRRTARRLRPTACTAPPGATKVAARLADGATPLGAPLADEAFALGPVAQSQEHSPRAVAGAKHRSARRAAGPDRRPRTEACVRAFACVRVCVRALVCAIERVPVCARKGCSAPAAGRER